MRFTAVNTDDNLIIIRDEKKEIVAFVPKESKYAQLLVASPLLLDEVRLSCLILSSTGQRESARRKTLSSLIGKVTPDELKRIVPQDKDDGYFVLVDADSRKSLK